MERPRSERQESNALRECWYSAIWSNERRDRCAHAGVNGDTAHSTRPAGRLLPGRALRDAYELGGPRVVANVIYRRDGKI
jgi:hypothetical protein